MLRLIYKHSYNIILLSVTLILVLFGCKSKDNQKENIDFNHIYFDYKIAAEEGYDNLTVILKYRDGSKTGDAFTPSILKSVSLDDEVLIPDSSRMNGVYYEIQKPIGTFSGKHIITFTTLNDTEIKEEINFSPMILLTEIPENIHREDLVLNFSGLENEDYVRLLLTDTSFFNDGINRIDTVRNNQLIISKKDLENLANGTILMEFIREFERPVNESSKAGGRLRINYTLRRSFNLQD